MSRKRELHRKRGLRQSVVSEALMEHRHNMWGHQDYTILAGNERVNGVGYTQYGHVIRLDPIVLVYAVKIELHTTTSFAGGGVDSWTIKLCMGTNCVEDSTLAASSHALTVTDISRSYTRFFPDFEPIDLGCSIKVSNAANPVDVFGVSLRWWLYEKDTHGDYAKPTDKLLIEPSIIDKRYVEVRDKEADEFEYLSGLGMS